MYKILVIDDDAFMQKIYSELLKEAGYEVISAYDGENGLRKLEKHSPDLVILDLVMPRMDGRSALFDIKKINRLLPVLIVSCKTAMKDDPEIRLNPQVYGFLSKPFEFQELYDKIQQVFERTEFDFKWEGRILGGYKLGERIGVGNSGPVYKGVRSEVTAAVKILSGFDEISVLRAQSEAQILAQLDHENIIKLLDVGAVGEQIYFIAMEYFSGENVQELLERETHFSQVEAANIVTQVAEAMDVAHESELVHRDLKPGNLLYSRGKNLVKIIDFGIARRVRLEKSITQKGCVVGTPLYMSPEQCRGDIVDTRTDIYNLGAVFYHLLTGKVPFCRSSIESTLNAHISDPLIWPCPSKLSLALKQIVEKMMAKEPRDRYPKMKNVVKSLDQIDYQAL